jgi:small subunit ribosomal protein S24e
LENPSKVAGSKAGSTASSGGDGKTQTLSDGTTVNYDQARQFMDWYCRRFGFPKEDITWEEVASGAKRRSQSSVWEAVMSVDNRRIGIGKGNNKKAAMTACYLDVTQYLESCDADLWKTFLAAAKSGKDLGMAPKVWLQMSDRLDDDVRDLCHDIKQSHLYKNRPVSTASTAANTAPASKRARFPASVQALETKSQRLKERRVAYEANPALQKMRTTRASLPVFTRAEEIIKHIDEHEVTICMAATGSGKTTQIPQIVLDDWIAKNKGAQCNIVCTQPRRLAAISVADRVAKERGEVVGQGSVGYQVRFEQKMAEDHGSITFCTIGIFLKRMQSALLEGGDSGGHNLDDVTHVIVDEVHERDVDTDLLLVVLKRLLDDRRARGKPIKVVLMSATIDPTLFQKYFPDAKGEPAQVIDIPGRSFPVTKHFLDDFLVDMSKARIARQVFQDKDVNKYLQSELSPDTLRAIGVPYQPESRAADEDSAVPAPLIAMTIAHVLGQSDSGHVLTFLPGWDDIMTVNRFLEEQGHSLGYNFKDSSKFTIHMLHSSVPLAEQQVIFEPPKEGVRRIILATNIAETSVTIPDVVYVVDSGKVKEQRYDPDRHMSSLVSAWIGGSNLNQRAGRAGRHRPGEYFGVLSRSRMEKLSPYQTVEMKRVDLSNVVMHVKALNFPGMSVEDVLAATIEPPADVRVAAAMQDLRMVGALDKDKNLTSLGRVLLQLPIEAQMGRMVLFGSFFRCLDSALTLAAILTNRDPFLAPMHLKDQAAAKKNYWVPVDHRSDVLATVSAYNAWWELQSTGQYVRANAFCSENFLSKPTLLTIQKIRVHLLQALRQAGVLDISGGGGTYHPPGRRRDDSVPAELNRNGDSLPLLTSLIAIASQPNFGLRVGNAYRTQQDKVCFTSAIPMQNELTIP